MNSDRSKNLCLKYERFTPSGGINKGIRKSEFVAKTQFLSETLSYEYDNNFPKIVILSNPFGPRATALAFRAFNPLFQ